MKVFIITLLITLTSYAQNYKFGKVSKEELKENFYPTDSSANAAFLYKSKEIDIVFNDQLKKFQHEETIHLRIKIYNKKGFKLGNQSIPYYTSSSGGEDTFYKLKAVTYNLEGNKVSKQKVSNKDIITDEKTNYYSFKKIAFPNLKPGSVIELKYTRISNYFDISTYRTQENIPIKKLFYRTAIPEYFVYKKMNKGYYVISPKTETINDSFIISSKYRSENYSSPTTTQFHQTTINFEREINEYNGTNIPALKNDEPFTSNYTDYRGSIYYELSYIKYPNSPVERYAKDWISVCEKLHDSYSFGKQLKKSNYFSKDLETLIKDKQTELDKIEVIFDFVKSKVHWNKHYSNHTTIGLEKAYKQGEGNIVEVNLLLIAMLKKAGIRAYPILLSTKSNGIPIFPTLKKINYVIAGVKNKNDELIFLDASSPYNAIDILPTRALNWQGRMLINKKVNTPVNLALKSKANEILMANVKFDEKLNISGTLQTKITGKKALDFRNRYNKYSDDKLKSKLQKKYHLNLDSYELNNKNDVNKPIILKAKISNAAVKNREIINGKLYINPLLFLKDKNNPFKLDKRKYPIDLVSPYKQIKRISIVIPEGYKVTSIPKSFKGKTQENEFSYQYLINVSDNLINLIAIKEINQSIIPTNKYDELKNIYKHFIDKNSEKIVLEKIN